MYPHLEKVMKDNGVTKTDISNLIGVHLNTVIDRISGETTKKGNIYQKGFTFAEAMRIHERFFAEYDIKWLFQIEETQYTPAS